MVLPLIATGVGALGSFLGGKKQASAAQGAAQTAAEGARRARKEWEQQVDFGRKEGFQGYDDAYNLTDAGYDYANDRAVEGYDDAYGLLSSGTGGALNALAPQRWDATEQLYDDMDGGFQGYLGRMMDGFEESPGYQFRLNQGLAAAKGLADARGDLYSGNTMTALNDYAQGAASDEWARYWGQGEDVANRLYGMSGREMAQGSERAGIIGAGANALANNRFQRGTGLAGMALDETNALAGNRLSRGQFGYNSRVARGQGSVEGMTAQAGALANGQQQAGSIWANTLNNVGQQIGYGIGGMAGGGGYGAGATGGYRMPGPFNPRTGTLGGI